MRTLSGVFLLNGKATNTLTIKTGVPFPEFPSELVHPNTSIIDVTETDFVNKPLGTGPFAVSSFTPGTAVGLIRYDEYWDGTSKLEKARFSFNDDANEKNTCIIGKNFVIVLNRLVGLFGGGLINGY